MAYNRYYGSSGRRERIEEKAPPPPEEPKAPLPETETPPEAPRTFRGSPDGIFRKLDPGRLEAEDLLILAVLWLAYRARGDKELLIAMAVYVLS